MYCIEAFIPAYGVGEIGKGDWVEVALIGQRGAEQAELQRARTLALELEGFYTRVRITRITPDGRMKVIR